MRFTFRCLGQRGAVVEVDPLAVDEFFTNRKSAPLFQRIDFTARACVKPVDPLLG